MIKKVFFYSLPILMLIFVTGAIDTELPNELGKSAARWADLGLRRNHAHGVGRHLNPSRRRI